MSNCQNYEKAIAYYRVSTKQQGASGLGLEAQRTAVSQYAAKHCLEVVAAFTEVETGTAKRDRVEIQKAIAYAREHNAVLLVAKLDRLSRSVAFTSALMESGIEFVACDMPNVNNMTIHIIAAVNEDETRRISQRTKAALSALKARGVQLGTPENLTPEAQLKSARINRRKAIEAYSQVANYIRDMRERDGMSYGKIAKRLNGEGWKTRTGGKFYATTVQRILDRVADGVNVG